ncbi:MAG: hypothetical protein COB40_08650 [Marinosulfonomonas sp.]|nr:MAG: hypothetical protein COB40_08650 [Marinosulfonomonas sp.]
MTLIKFVKNFAHDEDGAVTVDWVVLTAAIVGLGIAVLASVSSGTTSLADKISSNLSAQTITTY